MIIDTVAGGTGPSTPKVLYKITVERPAQLLTPGVNQTYRISYYAGTRLIAIREVGVRNSLQFIHTDHLGSVSVASNLAGAQVGTTQRYYPFGLLRPGSGAQWFTDAGFTGQIADAGTGLMYYNARYYAPYLNRFIQPDTVVPDAGDPQALNRYSYALSNPLKYTDPSGHCAESGGAFDNVLDCTQSDFEAMSWAQRQLWVRQFSTYTGVDTFKNLIGIIEYFRNDPVFADSEWASVSDAGVLHVIMHGYNLSQGNDFSTCSGSSACDAAASAWQAYFTDYLANRRLTDTGQELWGIAEQSGVDYGIQLARDRGVEISRRELFSINSFVGWGNIYRGMLELGLGRADQFLGLGFLDPSSDRSEDFVYLFSALWISPSAEVTYNEPDTQWYQFRQSMR